MGRLNFLHLHGVHPEGGDTSTVLTEIYGERVPHTARLLDRYLRDGCLPLHDPDHPEHVFTVDIRVAAQVFGADTGSTCRYLHQLHAAGNLPMDDDGVLDFPRTSRD